MAPLFTALVVVTGAVLFLALAFVCGRFFQPTATALRIALVLVAGAAIGGAVTAFGLAFFVPTTLAASWQVIAYLASLVVGAVLGCALLLMLCINHHVPTLRSSGPPQAASA